MINATHACQCGKYKQASRQFCQECWDSLPTEMLAIWMAKLEEIEIIINACNTLIKQHGELATKLDRNRARSYRRNIRINRNSGDGVEGEKATGG